MSLRLLVVCTRTVHNDHLEHEVVCSNRRRLKGIMTALRDVGYSISDHEFVHDDGLYGIAFASLAANASAGVRSRAAVHGDLLRTLRVDRSTAYVDIPAPEQETTVFQRFSASSRTRASGGAVSDVRRTLF